MKKLTWLITLLAATPAWGLQPATNMSYQGKLLDANGIPQNASFNMTFTIHTAATGGTSLWSETVSGVPVSNGVFSVQLGNVTPIPASVFASSPTYLSVNVGDGEMTPRQLLSASPYAFSAQRLASDGSVLVNSGLSFSTFTTAGGLFVPGGLTASSGTFSGQDTSGYSLKLSSGATMPAGTLAANVVQSAAGVFTGSGNSIYSVAASSGIRMANGTLKVLSAGGVDASGTGIIAATGTFVATGNSQYSLYTSSGISAAGTGGVSAPFFTGGDWRGNRVGSGFYQLNYNTQSMAGSLAIALTPGTVLSSFTITLPTTASDVLVQAYVSLTNAANTATTNTVTIHRGNSCAGTIVAQGLNYFTNTNAFRGTISLSAVDSPGATSVDYTLCAFRSASTVNATYRTLTAVELGE